MISILRTRVLFLIVGCLLFTACTKEEEVVLTPEQKVMQYLTGVGNRFWRIKEIYINKVKMALSSSQLDYNKTYTHYGYTEANTGLFADSDGFHGNWEIQGTDRIKETITNNPGGPVVLLLRINLLDTNNMDVEYDTNINGTLTTVRSVYFAY